MSQEIINYIPEHRENPRLADHPRSAWGDIPTILKDVITRFGINNKKALEFGVQFGYSTSALANYFDVVVGVDTFLGDQHSGFRPDFYEDTKNRLKDFPNVTLIRNSYQNFQKDFDDEMYDIVHIDIVHTYEDTFTCGEWSVKHSNVVIFHDTESFPDVKRACRDLANKYSLQFYNYEKSCGLGILVKSSKS